MTRAGSGADRDHDRPLLIVNADDYGLTVGVSRAILEAHRGGIVTSTSLLALAPGFDKTVEWLQDVPELGCGAHLAAVGEDPPLLSAREIPTLVDKSGRLRLSWRQFLPLAAAGRIDPDDLRRELAAQLDRILESHPNIDHVDTHQNLHLWPMVRRVVLQLGDERGIKAARITRSSARGPVGRSVAVLARKLERECGRSGWRYPEATVGLDEAGHLDRDTMVRSLRDIASTGSSSAELATHPGEADDPDRSRYRWGYRWPEELEALCSKEVRDTVEELGFRLGAFADLT